VVSEGTLDHGLFEHFGWASLSTTLFNLTPHKSVKYTPFDHIFCSGLGCCTVYFVTIFGRQLSRAGMWSTTQAEAAGGLAV
jgi:hypothetical protein